jgi:UDP-glucose 4-epimerase
MTILLFGGNGFIGFQLSKKFKKRGYQVVSVDDLSSPSFSKSRPDFVVNIHNAKDIRDIISKVKPNVVSLHAAKMNHHTPTEILKTNIVATQNIIDFSFKSNIDYFMFSSSAAVYNKTKKAVTEKSNTSSPSSIYGISKKTGEELLSLYADRYNIPSLCMRYSNVYGPTQHHSNGGVLSKFIDNINKKKPLIIHQNGKQIRDFIYIDDVVEANVKALENKISGIVNISTGKGTSINKLVQLFNKSIPNIPIQFLDSDQGVSHSILDNSLMKQKLCWEPTYTIKKGLHEIISKRIQ